MTVFQGSLRTVAAAAGSVCLLTASGEAAAECSDLPESFDLKCEKCTYPGAVWQESTDGKRYNEEVKWSSDEAEQDFEVIVVDSFSKTQVPWPYPLGDALYATVQGEFTVTDGETVVKFDINDPTHMYGTAPLALVSLKSPRKEVEFKITSLHHFYILSLGGDLNDGTLSAPKRLGLVLRPVDRSNPGKYVDREWKFVCSPDSIAVTSPCSIAAEPTSVVFDDMRAAGAQGALEQIKQTQVTIDCGGSAKMNEAYLRVFPAHPPADGTNVAGFVHVGASTPFSGLGLIYKLNSTPTSCSGGDEWQQSLSMGEFSKDNKATGTIYWGLCRTLPQADTGEYATTAILRFWVD